MVHVYSAIIAARRSFARSWTLDLKQRKIRVNAMSPGLIDTQVPRLGSGRATEGAFREEI